MTTRPNAETSEPSRERGWGLNVEVTPIIKWGGVLLLGLVLFFGIEKTTIFVNGLGSEVNALQSQKNTLLSVSEAPDVTAEIQGITDKIGQLENKYFRETTVGLNNAALQTLLTQLLTSCGLERLSIALRTTPSDTDRLAGQIIASVKGVDREKKIAACLYSLQSSTYAFEVVSLTWLSAGSMQLEIRAFYMPPKEPNP